MSYTYRSRVLYPPGAELLLPERTNLSILELPRCGVLPEMVRENGFWNECFFSIVFIRINVSNFGMLLTALLSSSSFISIKRQFSSSDGRGQVLFAVAHGCSCVFGVKVKKKKNDIGYN